MSKFCPNCGKPLEEGKKFCSNCGQKVESNPSVPIQNPNNTMSTQALEQQPQYQSPQPQYQQNTISVSSTAQKQGVLGKYLSWHGRVGRGTWLVRKIIIFIIIFISILVPGIALSSAMSSPDPGAGSMAPSILLILVPFCILASIAQDIKRCHDTDRSGDFLWVGCIPFYGWVKVPLVLYFKRGTKGPNKYGADPLA